MILAALALLTATPATLAATIAKASPGDIINATGTNGAVTLKDRNGLTIRGLRAASLTLRGGTGLTFVDTTIVDEPVWRHSPMVGVTDAKGVTFNKLTVTATPSAAGERKGYGVTIARSSGVAISDLLVTGVARGIVMGQSSDIAVRRARLTDLRSDGIQFGAIEGLLLEDVTVARLVPVRTGPVSTHDHADGIQGTAASSDVTIRRFTFSDGADGQGIFLSDARPPARYARIRVENAVMAPTHVRCLSIDKADGVFVRDVVCTPGSSARPGIYLQEVSALDEARLKAAVQVRDKRK